jgi:hypothetical protein
MKWKSVLLMLGAAGVTAALGDCQDKDLRTYLGANGRMYKWQEDVGKAICQLETKGTFGQPLDPAKRICPNGESGPGDKSTPPAYPPAQ